MTIRQRQRLLLVAGILIAFAAVMNIWNWAFREAFAPSALLRVLMPLAMSAAIIATWIQLRQQKAEHGPDFVMPVPAGRRHLKILMMFIAVLAVAAGYFVARHH